MADKLNVLVICGSLRKGSYNASVARALPALAPSKCVFATDLRSAAEPDRFYRFAPRWLEAAARAMGIIATATVRTVDELKGTLEQIALRPGPWLIVAAVVDSTPSAKPPLDCVFIKQRFMDAIGCVEPATIGGPS